MSSSPETFEADVLVVGAGGAALRAAIEARQAGAHVAVAVKGHLGRVGLRGAGATACGMDTDWRGYWPVDESEGVLEGALEDILQLGLGVADPRLARIVVEEAPSSLRALERLGVPIARPPAAANGRTVAGAYKSTPRPYLCRLVPSLATVARRCGCLILEQTMVTDLLMDEGKCVGALALREETGEVVAITAGAVIVGTGGAAHLFKRNVHPSCVTGDGYAMGYRAGAELVNLEFVQIFLGIVSPTISNLAGWVWREDGRMYNAEGKEFLENYLPQGVTAAEVRAQAGKHSPHTTRDSVSRYLNVAIMKEIMAGKGTAHGAVYLDLTSPSVRVPQVRESWLRRVGIDLKAGPVEVAPYAMCSNGGLRIDEHGQTTVTGLYAVGECSGGVYGADRHGGSMMATSQVFGARAGRHAARSATASKPRALPKEKVAVERRRIETLRSRSGAGKLGEARVELQREAWNNLLAVRTDEGLTRVLATVNELREERLPELGVEGPSELVEYLELENLLLVGEMLATVARERTESRGGHHREDYPARDDGQWLRRIAVRSVEGRMELRRRVIDPEWRERPGDMLGEHWG